MSRQRSEGGPRRKGLPMLGLGTWQNDQHGQCAQSVRVALEEGYRHVDTAQSYGNEEAVGEGIRESEVDRDDIFLATKVWTSNLGHEDVVHTTKESLEKLDTDYLDLLYVHWPANEYDPEGTLSAFQALQDDGLVDEIGVSNFEPRQLDGAIDVLDDTPFALQVECHPLLPQQELREYCDDAGIEFVAYSPLARGRVFDVPEVSEVAEKHDASEAQVSLAWLRHHDLNAIPKATSGAHVRDNWASLDVKLDDEDVAKIDGVEARERQVDPDFGPWN